MNALLGGTYLIGRRYYKNFNGVWIIFDLISLVNLQSYKKFSLYDSFTMLKTISRRLKNSLDLILS